jgi:hypothetical protein
MVELNEESVEKPPNNALSRALPRTASTRSTTEDKRQAAQAAARRPPLCKTIFRRKNVLRAALLVSLMAAALICAGLAYKQLSDSEQEVAEKTYESIANSATLGAKTITERKLQGSEVMATLLSWSVPDVESWPMIDIAGYIPISNSVAKLTDSTTQSLMVFVQPDFIPLFETHTKAMYVKHGRPSTAGVSDFGFGIWKPDMGDSPMYEDARLHDTTGAVSTIVVF